MINGTYRIALTRATELKASHSSAYLVGSGTDEAIKILTPLANDDTNPVIKALRVLAKLNHHQLRYIDFDRELVGGAFEVAIYNENGWTKLGYSYWDHDVASGEARSLGGPRLLGYQGDILYVGDIVMPGKKSKNWVVPGDGGVGVQEDYFPCVIRPSYNINLISNTTIRNSEGGYPVYIAVERSSESSFIAYSVRDDGLCFLSRSKAYLDSIDNTISLAKTYARDHGFK